MRRSLDDSMPHSMPELFRSSPTTAAGKVVIVRYPDPVHADLSQNNHKFVR